MVLQAKTLDAVVAIVFLSRVLLVKMLKYLISGDTRFRSNLCKATLESFCRVMLLTIRCKLLKLARCSVIEVKHLRISCFFVNIKLICQENMRRLRKGPS